MYSYKPRPPTKVSANRFPRDEEIYNLKTIIDEKDFEIQKLKKEALKAREEKELELRQLRREKDKVIQDKEIEINGKKKDYQRLRDEKDKITEQLNITQKRLGNATSDSQTHLSRLRKVQDDHQREVAQTNVLRKRLEDLQNDYNAYLAKINLLRQSDDSTLTKLKDEIVQLRNEIIRVNNVSQDQDGRVARSTGTLEQAMDSEYRTKEQLP